MSAQAATTQAAAVKSEGAMGGGYTTTDLYPASRLERAAEAAAQAGLDALLLTPGPELRYLTGYDTHQSERLTCLAVPAAGRAFLVVPRLELASAKASPVSGMDLDLVVWDETGDPYQAVAQRLGSPATVGLAGQMWAMMVLRFRDAMPGARQGLGEVGAPDVQRGAVASREHSRGLEAQVTGGPGDADGDLAAVGDQDLVEHQDEPAGPIRNRGCPASISSPFSARIASTTPGASAEMSMKVFIASMMHIFWPISILAPTSTSGRSSGAAAR